MRLVSFEDVSSKSGGGAAEHSPTPLTDRIRSDPALAEAFDAMDAGERYYIMREMAGDGGDDVLVAEIAEVMRFVADNFDAVEADDFHFSLMFIPVRRVDDMRGGPLARELLRVLDEIIEESRASGNPRAELFFMNLKADPFLTAEAIIAERAAHRRAAELGLLDDPIAGDIRSGIATSLRSLSDDNRPEEAVRAGRDTIAEMEAAGLKMEGWGFLNNYGEALALAGLGEESDRAFEAALAALKAQEPWSIEDPSRRQRAILRRIENAQFVSNQWAFYLNIQGRFADAEAPGAFAAVMAERLEGRESISTQKSRYNYAVALLGQGKAGEALPFFEEALPLQRAEEAEGGWRPQASYKTDTVLLLTTLARARIQVEGREADALAAAVEAADVVRFLRDERLRGGAQGNSADPGAAALAQAVARGERRDPLSPAFDMVLLTGWLSAENGEGNVDTAFRAAQDLTLNEAGSAISQAAARELAGEGELGGLVRERQDTAAQILRVNSEYREASLGSDTQETARLRAELDGLGNRLAAIDARLDTEFPEYGDLVAPRSVGTEAVSAALGADEALLMLLPSEGHDYVFAITREGAVWHRAEDGAATSAALVERLRCRMDEATCSDEEYGFVLDAEDASEEQPTDSHYPRYDQAAAYRLFAQLIAPVAGALEGKSVIYTVAAGPVAGLPLAALVTSEPDPETAASGDPQVLREAPWLGNRHAFITLPSVSAITLPRPAQARTGRGLIGYGAPVLEGAGAAQARGSERRRRRGGTAALRASNFFSRTGEQMKVDPAKLRRLDPLPGTERELSMLARSLEGGQAGLRLGADATEGAVKRDTSLSDAGIVVFATHGLLPGEMGQAAEPGLVLTPPETGDEFDDGLLTASEAAELSLIARWVILSACNTATPGGAQGAEALSGLARAFLYAGADSLLASHWRVSDDASAALTVQTIRAAQSGRRQAEALQAGQIAVRTGIDIGGEPIADWAPHWSHPAAWAPFTLITDHNQ